MERYNTISKKKGIIQFFCKEKGIDEDEYKKNQGDDPDDYPRWKSGTCSTAVLNLDEVEEEFDAVAELIKGFEDRAGNAGDSEDQEAAFTGIVFVVCQWPSDCYKVSERESGFMGRVCKSWFSCCLAKEKLYRWDRAPEPTDVYWENLGVGWWERVVRGFLSDFFTFIMVVICFAAVGLLKLW